jgi:2-C-methyl-D-erythritol 4-phosphate cytidylyltransferase
MPPHPVTAVIVAAGSGRRMGSAVAKQFLPLAGRPLMAHSLETFLDHPEVDRVVVVLPAGGPAPELPAGVTGVPGGPTRQESVRLGLEAAGDHGWVLIHDAARPLVSSDLIDRVLAAARASGAAVPAVPAGDTVKQVDGEVILSTLDRRRLVQVQTPQCFRTDLWREAHEAARRDGFLGTDDSQLVERAGHRVTWVEGSPRNLKVTTEADLELASALVARRAQA